MVGAVASGDRRDLDEERGGYANEELERGNGAIDRGGIVTRDEERMRDEE